MDNVISNDVEVITDLDVQNTSSSVLTIDQMLNNQNNNTVSSNVNNITDIPFEQAQPQVTTQSQNDVNNQIQTPELIQPYQAAPEFALPKKKDKVLLIQIVLLISWVIITILVYFFGYSLFEPFIKV